MKRILVTGGAGFIGGNLCKGLIKSGKNEVFSLDNYSSGSTDNHIDGVEYIVGDTNDISSVLSFVPDTVYHLGEYSRVEQSFHDLTAIRKSNLSGTFAVVQFCTANECKLVYAASSTKFADNGEGRGQSPYGYSKAINTELVQNFGNWFNLEYAITYFYNAFGPGEIRSGKYATLIASFAERMRFGQALTVVAPGTQVRNFTHVHDIVSGLMLVGEKGSGDGFGIGVDRAYSILEVAEMFGGQIEMLSERAGNRANSDLVNAETIKLGWRPQHNLKDYIEELRENNWIDLGDQYV